MTGVYWWDPCYHIYIAYMDPMGIVSHLIFVQSETIRCPAHSWCKSSFSFVAGKSWKVEWSELNYFAISPKVLYIKSPKKMEIDRNSLQTSEKLKLFWICLRVTVPSWNIRKSEKLRHPKASSADPCSLVLENAMPPSRTSGGTWIQIRGDVVDPVVKQSCGF